MRHVEASSLRRDVPNSRHGASFESLCLSSHKSTSHGTNSGEILMQSIQNNFLKIFIRLSLWLGNLLLRKIDCNLRSSIIITDRIQVTNCLKAKYSCSLANWGYWKRKHRFYFAVRAQIDVKTVASCTQLLHNYWCAKITKIFQIKFKMH